MGLFSQEPWDQLGVGIGPDATEVWVNHELFANCTPLMQLYNKTLGDRGLYKYEIESDEVNVAFKMIRDNVTTVRTCT